MTPGFEANKGKRETAEKQILVGTRFDSKNQVPLGHIPGRDLVPAFGKGTRYSNLTQDIDIFSSSMSTYHKESYMIHLLDCGMGIPHHPEFLFVEPALYLKTSTICSLFK